MSRDPGIDTLLELDGWIADQGDGYWIKINAWRVEASPEVPHGIRYSLTLHDRYGTRLLGYDNAHAPPRPKKYKYAGRVFPYDHKHSHAKDKGTPYEFENAERLLVDFFDDVDGVLRKLRSG